jgi:hypothetical protein
MQKAGEESTEEVDVRKQLIRETFTRVMRIINEALTIFDEEGPNIERSANVTRVSEMLFRSTDRKKDERLPEVLGLLL